MWHLIFYYLFLKTPSFGALERLCYVIVTCPGYLHLYFLTRYQKIDDNVNTLQSTVCLIINPVMVDNFVSLFPP